MTHVSPPRFMLLVDTHVGPSPNLELQIAVERTIAMAASLASEMLQQGLPMGLLVWSDGWRYLPPNRGKRHYRDVLSMLARLPLNKSFNLRALLDQSFRHQKSGTTAMLMTPHQLQLGLGDYAHGGLFVFSPDSEQTKKWFTFAETVDFTRCMPVDQQIEGGSEGVKV